MRTCHPVTRMPVEFEGTHANQGALLTIIAQIVLEKMVNHAHAYGSATRVELSIRTSHPVTRVTIFTRMTVTRMTVETIVNANQGTLFPILVKSV